MIEDLNDKKYKHLYIIKVPDERLIVFYIDLNI